ncbi:unnamed protein product [Larinioides sclopetarius]|uniref:Secreted protein n=1 Tax=Larinioides sclopetarius TaxID=280406 RepID=A0AAV2C0A1_9ARAC
MIMKGLVILLLAVMAVQSQVSRRPVKRIPVVLPQRVAQESASSLGGAQVGTYSHSRGQPNFVRGRFPAFFPQFAGADEYAASLGGAPVGLYSREHNQGGRLARGRFPQFAGADEYASSLGGAPVGLYSRDHNQGGRPGRARLPVLRQPVDSEYGASLGGAEVGVYRRDGSGRGSDVSGASLGKAPVGLHARE